MVGCTQRGDGRLVTMSETNAREICYLVREYCVELYKDKYHMEINTKEGMDAHIYTYTGYYSEELVSGDGNV
jgi:hypothetical protein